MYDAARWERFTARHQVTRGHILLVALFGIGHPERSFASLLRDFIRGKGPAARAAGRAV